MDVLPNSTASTCSATFAGTFTGCETGAIAEKTRSKKMMALLHGKKIVATRMPQLES
jgi:hypothetical protein